MSSVKERVTKKCHSDPRVTIDAIHTNLLDTLSPEQKVDYYLENGLLLNDYYNNSKSVKKDVKKNHILSFFPQEVSEERKVEEKKEEDMKSHITQYIENIDDTHLNMDDLLELNDKCMLCNHKMCIKQIHSELVCINCGYTKDIIINSEKSSFKDPPREASYFAYKRINHFNEWLAQFQAKETTEIPEEIYKNIYLEIKKNINLDISQITHKQVRDILKKLDYNKYYEHIPHIINIMNGKKAPILKRNEEEQLRSLFKEIQVPFSNNCPLERKNFLSYSYVLHKFCELLEYDELLVYFPLLKSREKLQQQDQIWKLICKDLLWEYIPSI